MNQRTLLRQVLVDEQIGANFLGSKSLQVLLNQSNQQLVSLCFTQFPSELSQEIPDLLKFLDFIFSDLLGVQRGTLGKLVQN